MTKTIEVAADRAFDKTKTVLPAEVAQGVYIHNAPSLRALKLMHLMISTAGGRMADDVTHDMRLSDVRKIEGMAHHDQKSLKPLFVELRAATIIHDKPEQSKWTIGGLLDEATVDYRHELTGDVLISWSFGRTFRRIAAESNHWAILDRQAIFHLGSKYSVLLFQHISSLLNLKHTNSKTFSVPELRAVLGVPDGKLKRFANLKKDAISVAIAEINSDLTRLTLEATYHKTGRTVTSVTIAWRSKADIKPVKVAQADHSIARVGKQKEAQERLSFPAKGSVKYSDPWQRIARDNCNWDMGKVADAFRSFCAQRKISLSAKNLEEIFTNFCAAQPNA